jgi:hypothetical protein
MSVGGSGLGVKIRVNGPNLRVFHKAGVRGSPDGAPPSMRTTVPGTQK